MDSREPCNGNYVQLTKPEKVQIEVRANGGKP